MKVINDKIDGDLRCKIDELWELWKSKGIPATLNIGLSDDYYDAFALKDTEALSNNYYVNYTVIEEEEE